MATKGSNPRKGATSGGPALDRLGGSIEAAQEALKDLRHELSKGGRDLVRDLDVLLRDARKNLRGVQRTLIKDLDEMQKAATGKRRPMSKPAKRTPAATASAKRVAGKRTSATKRTGASSPPRKPAARTTRAARKT
jgi:hypothetical protein